jgi:hypothetical protein
VPPKWTTAPLTRLVPVTVKVNPAPPAVAINGERLEVVGTGLLTVKVSAGVEVPPPGAGFVTVTDLVPAVVISEAAISALTWVASMSAVV